MDVPSFAFLGFAAVGALLYNLSPRQGWRAAVLLICNLAFVASFAESPAALAPFTAFLAAGYGAIHAIRRRPQGLVLAIVAALVAFFWLKQYSFIPKDLVLKSPYVTVGLSYVFFRVLHLIIDARNPRAAEVGIVDYVNYTLNFMSLVSGPIQRFDDYQRTAKAQPAALDAGVVGQALQRIVLGLFKVMVLALALGKVRAHLLAASLASPDPVHGALYAAAAVGAFPVYLYWNFSGYVDVVLGVARLFRLALPENFNQPFLAASFIDYWNRWHMSLSNWLKTYVYNPLLMSLMRRFRGPKLEPYLGAFALFVTFFLIGAWHGQTPAFLVFGLLNGLGVAVNQVYRTHMTKRMGRKAYAALSKRPMYVTLCRGATLSWVAFTLVWFWGSWPTIASLSAHLGPFGLSLGLVVLTIGSTLGLAALIEGRRWLEGRLAGPAAGRLGATAGLAGAMLACVWLVQSVLQSPAPEIIYKSF